MCYSAGGITRLPSTCGRLERSSPRWPLVCPSSPAIRKSIKSLRSSGELSLFLSLSSLLPLTPSLSPNRLLGTPTLQTLPSLPSLPDFRPSFPKWRPQQLSTVLPELATTPDAISLLEKMLVYEPSRRITAKQALREPYFSQENELGAFGGFGGGRAAREGLGAYEPRELQRERVQQPSGLMASPLQ